MGIYERDDPLEVVLASGIPAGVYSYLRDIAGDWFVPGLENAPTIPSLTRHQRRGDRSAMVVLAARNLWRESPPISGHLLPSNSDPASNYGATDTTDIDAPNLWGTIAR
jgi:hypothetical protein